MVSVLSRRSPPGLLRTREFPPTVTVSAPFYSLRSQLLPSPLSVLKLSLLAPSFEASGGVAWLGTISPEIPM